MNSDGMQALFKNGDWVNGAEGTSRSIAHHDANAEAQRAGAAAGLRQLLRSSCLSRSGR